MARDDLHFRLRIPEALKARVEESAAENNRSMTAEIISRLERSFDDDQDMAAVIADLEGRIEKLERLVDRHEDALNPTRYDRD